MAKLPLKTAVKTATRSPMEELLEKPVKLKDRTPDPAKPAGKAAGGRLSEPKAAGSTVIVAADSTQPGSGEIRRMVEAGEPLPTDLKGLVKVSDAIRAGASASAVKPYILSMGNKRKRQTLADGGSIHRRLAGTGYGGANRKGQFQKGRGKTGKPGSKAESASPGSPQAGGTDYVSKKESKMSSTEGPSPGSKGTLGERTRKPTGGTAESSGPPHSPPAKFTPAKDLPPPAFGPKRGVAATKAEGGGVGGVVGKMAGKVAGKAAGGLAKKAGGVLMKGGKKLLSDASETPYGQMAVAGAGGVVADVREFREAVKAGRVDRATAIVAESYIPTAKVWIHAMRWFEKEMSE